MGSACAIRLWIGGDAGLRHILVHEYFGIDVQIIWDIVTSKLPDLERQIRQILKDG
jgi:uncharacterized protein with HEPN domain